MVSAALASARESELPQSLHNPIAAAMAKRRAKSPSGEYPALNYGGVIWGFAAAAGEFIVHASAALTRAAVFMAWSRLAPTEGPSK